MGRIEKNKPAYNNDENNEKPYEGRFPGELWNSLISPSDALFHAQFL